MPPATVGRTRGRRSLVPLTAEWPADGAAAWSKWAEVGRQEDDGCGPHGTLQDNGFCLCEEGWVTPLPGSATLEQVPCSVSEETNGVGFSDGSSKFDFRSFLASLPLFVGAVIGLLVLGALKWLCVWTRRRKRRRRAMPAAATDTPARRISENSFWEAVGGSSGEQQQAYWDAVASNQLSTYGSGEPTQAPVPQPHASDQGISVISPMSMLASGGPPSAGPKAAGPAPRWRGQQNDAKMTQASKMLTKQTTGANSKDAFERPAFFVPINIAQPQAARASPVPNTRPPAQKNFVLPTNFVKAAPGPAGKSSTAKPPPKLKPMAKAVFNYVPAHPDEMQMYEGDIIHGLEKAEGDWWRGTNQRTGVRGLFPSNYVKFSHMY